MDLSTSSRADRRVAIFPGVPRGRHAPGAGLRGGRSRLCRDSEATGHVAGGFHRHRRDGAGTGAPQPGAGAGRGAVHCRWRRRRRRPQYVVLPRYRRANAPHRPAASADRADGAGRGARLRRRARGRRRARHGRSVELVSGGAARFDYWLLRLRLHDPAEAADAAEHRHWRCRGRRSAGDRLGGGDRQHRLGAAALFAIVFLWTPPHFWALSLYRVEDYAAARVPMLPVVAGTAQTRRQLLAYCLGLWPASFAPCMLGTAGVLYGAAAVVLNAAFTGLAIRLWGHDGDRAARQMFSFSLLLFIFDL